jgi:hypothetical protein
MRCVGLDQAFTDHVRNEHRLLDVLSAAERDQLEVLLARWLGRIED